MESAGTRLVCVYSLLGLKSIYFSLDIPSGAELVSNLMLSVSHRRLNSGNELNPDLLIYFPKENVYLNDKKQVFAFFLVMTSLLQSEVARVRSEGRHISKLDIYFESSGFQFIIITAGLVAALVNMLHCKGPLIIQGWVICLRIFQIICLLYSFMNGADGWRTWG